MKDEFDNILILINPKNNYKILLNFKYGVITYIFPIYNNVFLITAHEHLYIYNFIPYFENIQLICDISDFKFEVYESFKFNQDIFVLIFYFIFIFFPIIKQ